MFILMPWILVSPRELSDVSFVTSNTENKLLTKKLEKDDVFVFLEGLIHF